MNNVRTNKINLALIYSTIFIFLIVLGGLNHSKGILLSKVGFFSIGTLLILGSIYFLGRFIKKTYILKKEKWMYLLSLLFVGIYVLSILYNINFDAFRMAIQVLVVFLYFWGVVYFPFEHFNYKLSYYFIIIFILFHVIWWMIEGGNIPFSGIMNNPNSFGIFISTLLALFIVIKNICVKNTKCYSWIVIVCGLLLVYSSNSRAAWLMILASWFSFFIWPVIIKKKIFFNLYLLAIYLVIFIISVIYPKLLLSQLGYTLQEISRNYTGKNFFSGRQIIWEQLLRTISEKPLLGYGAATRPGEVLDITLSAHNFYLQMTLQVGLVGTLIFCLFVLSVWNYLYISRNNKIVKLTGAIFIGILIYQVFEVSFTQNMLAVSIIQWLIIGMGVHYSRREILQKKYVKLN